MFKSKYWGPFFIGFGTAGSLTMFVQTLYGKEGYIEYLNNNWFDIPLIFPISLLAFGIIFSIYVSRSKEYVD